MNNIFVLIEALERCLKTLESIKGRTVLSNEDIVEINKVIDYCFSTHKHWQDWTESVFERLTNE